MLLIEAEGKRIWHTGDFRSHGYLGDRLFPTLKLHATNIDVLIIEGTMLKREDECIHETEVSKRMAEEMENYKYIVVLASATDMERLASIKEAAQKAKKDMYVCSPFLKKTMRIFTKREACNSNGLFDFHPKNFNFLNRFFMKRKGFVLIAGASQLFYVKALCGDLTSKDLLLIYSSWDGYYKDPVQVAINPNYKNFRDAFSNVIDIHTSGHADKATIHKVIETVCPKEVICIHKEADATL
jgi:ribonuclease J